MTSRFLRKTVVALGLALASGSFLVPQVAEATTFAPMTIEQFTDASTWIVEGTVTEVWTELDTEKQRVWTRARISVGDTLKGPSAKTEIVVDSFGGTFGSLSTSVPGQAEFSVGEDVFLFLFETEDGRIVPVSKFLGKYTIRRAAGDTRKHVMNWHPRPGQVFDHRFLPHPAPEERVYLDDLREQVQQRLDTGWDGKAIPGVSLEKLQQINTLERRMPR